MSVISGTVREREKVSNQVFDESAHIQNYIIAVWRVG